MSVGIWRLPAAGDIGLQRGQMVSRRDGSTGREGLILSWNVLVEAGQSVGSNTTVVMRWETCAYGLSFEKGVAQAERRKDDIRRLVGPWESRHRGRAAVHLERLLEASDGVR